MTDFDLVRPATLDEVVRILGANPGRARILAGGTDIVPLMREGLAAPRILISLRKVPDLDRIEEREDGVSLGPAVTLNQALESAAIRERFPALAAALELTATPQVRNAGTLAGNLCQRPRCWYFRGPFDCAKKGGDRCFAADGANAGHAIFSGGPCHIVHPSDPASALGALSARLRLRSAAGTRTIPVEEFFVESATDVTREIALEPGEMIESIELPAPLPGQRSAFLKVAPREAFAFALVNVAVVAVFEEDRVRAARIVLGGVAPVPRPALAAAAALLGRTLETGTIAAAAAAAVEGARPLARNGYKVGLARNLVARALESLAR